jgi:hypothetical protein
MSGILHFGVTHSVANAPHDGKHGKHEEAESHCEPELSPNL